jgi:hypothetical protein
MENPGESYSLCYLLKKTAQTPGVINNQKIFTGLLPWWPDPKNESISGTR